MRKSDESVDCIGDPEWTRTTDLRLRRHVAAGFKLHKFIKQNSSLSYHGSCLDLTQIALMYTGKNGRYWGLPGDFRNDVLINSLATYNPILSHKRKNKQKTSSSLSRLARLSLLSRFRRDRHPQS